MVFQRLISGHVKGFSWSFAQRYICTESSGIAVKINHVRNQVLDLVTLQPKPGWSKMQNCIQFDKNGSICLTSILNPRLSLSFSVHTYKHTHIAHKCRLFWLEAETQELTSAGSPSTNFRQVLTEVTQPPSHKTMAATVPLAQQSGLSCAFVGAAYESNGKSPCHRAHIPRMENMQKTSVKRHKNRCGKMPFGFEAQRRH